MHEKLNKQFIAFAKIMEEYRLEGQIALLDEIINDWDPYSPHDELPPLMDKRKELIKAKEEIYK